MYATWSIVIWFISGPICLIVLILNAIGVIHAGLLGGADTIMLITIFSYWCAFFISFVFGEYNNMKILFELGVDICLMALITGVALAIIVPMEVALKPHLVCLLILFFLMNILARLQAYYLLDAANYIKAKGEELPKLTERDEENKRNLKRNLSKNNKITGVVMVSLWELIDLLCVAGIFIELIVFEYMNCNIPLVTWTSKLIFAYFLSLCLLLWVADKEESKNSESELPEFLRGIASVFTVIVLVALIIDSAFVLHDLTGRLLAWLPWLSRLILLN